ncbi:biotin--[acetyl-CoA-carboxylase] ligase [Altericroceibacterium spongiae]|uniref:biotin--[biotin carboxyl-carrier protein] ligase n=1 Tax=Altericroceibacterium spongiae TaxID=2320269 RepID=A0A420ERF4_9SPHN|nr:biotin--[acetyl-CoA-carboxylase] ligase [Altericroceibacterium spongiae]RKF23276.1 biotin--[acetyl-CoA-carboxylase] ligase [Altericroceibacterium spongiae]
MIEFVAETGSTNADLLSRLMSGEKVAEGDWLVANRQTAGRGRQGRSWLSEAGNFYGSTVVFPQASDPVPAGLSFVTALALYEALVPMLERPDCLRLKWPNDVLLDGAKLAGILLESKGSGPGSGLVIGVGVNLAAAPAIADRDVRSVAGRGVAPDRDLFASRLAESFSKELRLWRQQGLSPVLERWLAVAHPVGTPLSVHATDSSRISGRFAGLGDDGALLLEDNQGKTHRLHAGDVMLGRN